jgi:hypothetical protein
MGVGVGPPDQPARHGGVLTAGTGWGNKKVWRPLEASNGGRRATWGVFDLGQKSVSQALQVQVLCLIS